MTIKIIMNIAMTTCIGMSFIMVNTNTLAHEGAVRISRINKRTSKPPCVGKQEANKAARAEMIRRIRVYSAPRLLEFNMVGASACYVYDDFLKMNPGFDVTWLSDEGVLKLKKGNRRFYKVYFYPKSKNEVGGDYQVFVDANTKEIIHVISGG